MANASRPLDCDNCPVADRAVCAALDSREKSELAGIGRTADFAPGEVIFAQGGDSLACATLIEGVVKLSRIDAQGTERISAILHPAGFLGRLFSAQSDCFATAITRCRLCLFPRREFERVMENNPGLTRSILRRTLDELADSRELIDLIGRRSSEARLAGFLLMVARGLCEEPEDDGELGFELPLSRGEIAGLLGLTIETVSRQLARLEAAGLIARRGAREIAILDREGLKAPAGV